MPVHARGPLGLTDVPNRRFDTVVMGRGTHELAHPGRGVAHDLFEGPFTPTAFVPAWSRELDGGVRIEEYARKV